ncbi:MAG: ABC transporter ATP-binding protein [Bacteroidota bacterium]
MAYIEIHNICKKFAGRQVLDNISVTADKGEFLSLLGLSGCGKTTLLRIIAGLETADSGKIIIDGRDLTQLPPQQRNIGIVFQNYALFPHMNVYDNIAFGLKILKIPAAQVTARIDAVLQKVRLAHKSKQSVSLLSGGEQQRVALARAIVTEPGVMLFDEPLSNLDHSLRLQARNELKRLQNDIGVTSVYVTHDQSEALALSDKIAVMNAGKIVQAGTPADIYYHPADAFVADFVGHYNTFTKEQAATLLQHYSPSGPVAVLPENLHISNTGSNNAVIINVLFTGAMIEYILNAQGLVLKALTPSGSGPAYKREDKVTLSADTRHIITIKDTAHG